MIEGVLPALITPFTKDNKIDKEGLTQNIEFLIENGVSGIVPCGTMGEAATLSKDAINNYIEKTGPYNLPEMCLAIGNASGGQSILKTHHILYFDIYSRSSSCKREEIPSRGVKTCLEAF